MNILGSFEQNENLSTIANSNESYFICKTYKNRALVGKMSQPMAKLYLFQPGHSEPPCEIVFYKSQEGTFEIRYDQSGGAGNTVLCYSPVHWSGAQ